MSTEMPCTPKLLSARNTSVRCFDRRTTSRSSRETEDRPDIQRITTAEAIASPDFQQWLAAQNATGADVFVGMNPIKDGAYRRTKESISDIRHLYLDLDRSGDGLSKPFRNSSDVPPPNFILDTSPGKHQVVWKVSGFSQDEAESVLHMLANQFGGDNAATDSTRVLRLPGFANHKLAQEFIVQARQESDGVYSRRTFTLDEGMPESQKHLINDNRRPQVLHAEHKSQSERDWAYAKRALTRGLPPEEVMRDIAEFRADDKHDPADYARRTVTKAQAELRNASSLEIPSTLAGDESSQDRSH